MTEKIEISTSGGQKLRGIHQKPERDFDPGKAETLVVMLHGFHGHKSSNNDLFGDMENTLAQNLLHSLRFDFRGHGESDGKMEDFTIKAACEDIQDIFFWAERQGYCRFILIGEGLGASLAIMNYNANVAAMVLLWPVFDLPAFADTILFNSLLTTKVEKQGYMKVKDGIVGIPFVRELRKTKFKNVMKQAKAPTLILHGALDELVPIEQLDIGRENLGAGRIEITTFHDGEAGLTKMNHREAVFQQVGDFTAKYIH